MMSPILSGLMILGGITILQDYFSGKGWENIWLLLFVLLTLGGLVFLFMAGLAMALRSRIILEFGTMNYRGLFNSLALTPQTLEGYRTGNGQFLLFMQGKKLPLNLSLYDQQHALHDWLDYFSVNLDVLDKIREEDKILQDAKLGANEEARQQKLQDLRRDAHTLNGFAYIAATGGFANFAFLENQAVHQLAITLMIVLPVLMMFLMLKNLGYVKFDSREGSSYPEVLTGWMACSMSIALISLFDANTLPGTEIYWWILFLTLASCFIFVLVEGKNLLLMLKKQWLHAVLAFAGYIFIASYWFGGSVYQINLLLDVDPVEWVQSSVSSARIKREKFSDSYYFKVASWQGSDAEPIEINVTQQEFSRFKPGDNIRLELRSGALGISWIGRVQALHH